MPIIKARSSSLINNVDLRGTPTAPTANAGTASTQLATTSFVGTAVTNLIDSSPNVLDTLNELAAAINDDASFATTVTNSIATKVALAGDTMTGFLTLHADPTSNLHAATKQYVDAETLAITINSTDDVPEGVTNLYYTDGRVRSGISLTSDNTTVLDYDLATGAFSYNHPTSDGVLEGSTNQYYTNARARASVSLVSDDSTVLSYSSSTGVFTFTKQGTDKTVEGATNLYHTTARARAALSAGSNINYNSATGVISTDAAVHSVNGATGVVVLDTDNITEGSSNLYFTNGRAAAAISLTSNDQNMLAYNSGTGAFTFVKPSTDGISEGLQNWYFTDARVRAAMSVSGDLTYNGTTGIVGFALTDHDTDDITEGAGNLYFTDARARSAISLTTDDNNILAYNTGTGVLTFVTPDTDSIDEGAGNLYFTDARARNSVSMTDVSGDGSLSYDSATGVFTYTGPSAAEARAHLSAGIGISYNSATGVISATIGSFDTDDIAEGSTNLYYTDARVRNALSGGTGVTFNVTSGAISIGQAVGTTDNVTFNDVVVDGNLTVSGTTTSINTETIEVSDNIIVLNSNATGAASVSAGIEIERGNDTNVTLLWDEAANKWTVGAGIFVAAMFEGDVTGNLTGNVTGQVSDVSNHDTDDITEGAGNLYYLDSRARSSVSVSDVSGDGSLSYNSATGVITYTGPSAAEVRAHLSVTDVSGDGSLSYNNTTGVITYTGPSAAEVRAHISVSDFGGDGKLVYNSTTGVISYTGPSALEVRAHLSATDAGGDGSLSYDSTTGVIAYTGPSAVETRAHFSASFVSGDGDFTYDAATGVFSVTGPSAVETRAHFSVTKVDGNPAGLGDNIAYDSATGVITYTSPLISEIRTTVSAVDSGGDGSLSYNSATGVFTYTGPSAAEARAHLSATGDLSYNSSTGVIDFSMSNHDTGDLAEGANLYYTDARARGAVSLTTDDSTVLAYNSTTGVFTFDLGNTNTDKVIEGASNLYFTTARARNSVSAGSNINYDATTGVISTDSAVHSVNGQTGVVVLDTDNITEGSTNLYYTDARARTAVSLVSDDNNILAYNTGTGVLTFVTPDTDSIDEGAVNLYYTNGRADGRIAAASIRDLSDVDSVSTLNDGFTLVWSSSAQQFVPQNVTTATTTQNFTANGTDTSFALGFEVVGIENTTVFINGLYQAPTYSYTINTANGDTSVVFDTAPEANDVITVRSVSGATLNAQGVLNEDSQIDGGSF